MKNSTKAIALSALVVGVLTVGTTSTYAMGFGNFADMETGLIDKIVSVFKLNKSDVQKVFTDYRTEKQNARQAEMTTKNTERLTTLVKEGKITEDQKNFDSEQT
ncbi:MAG: hypothetical protein U0525_03345 [Patescibacteria group bacterium]